VVFDVGNGEVAKIYFFKPTQEHKNKLEMRFRKIELLTKAGVCIDGVLFPKKIIFNDKNEFVGYVMDKADGTTLHSLLFGNSNLSKKELVKICLDIAQKFKALHELNIIVGDVNLLNIKVDSAGKVFFFDTDSFQIEGFPCTVGTMDFAPPELQNKEFQNILRSIEHENFAIAMLFFRILHKGKSPYAVRGGGGVQENIMNKNFPYQLDGKPNDKIPTGHFNDLWRGLGVDVRRAFYDTFKLEKRLSSAEWVKVFEEFLAKLNNYKNQI